MESLREGLIRFARDYPRAKTEPLKNHPLSAFMRKELPSLLAGLGGFDPSEYKVAGSVGKGTWAEIPWLAVFRNSETDTLHHGLFIILAFNAELTEICLSVNQGSVSYYDDGHTRSETDRYLLENASSISGLMDTRGFTTGRMDLGATSSVGRFLQNGSICYRRYVLGELPSDDLLSDDLAVACGLYDSALEAKGRLGMAGSPY